MRKAKPEHINLEESEKGALVLKQNIGADFVQSISRFFRAVETHERSNSIFNKLNGDMFLTVNTWMSALNTDHLQLNIIGDQIFLNDVRLRPKPRNFKSVRSLLQRLRSRGIIGFSIPRVDVEEDIIEFFWILQGLDKEASLTMVTESLRAKGLSEFKVKSLSWAGTKGRRARTIVENVYDQMHEIADRILSQQIDLDRDTGLEQLLFELNSAEEADLISFFCKGHLPQRNKPLPHVCVATAFLLHTWGKSLGLPPMVNIELSLAGFLHPLGRINHPADLALDPMGVDRAATLFKNVEKFKKNFSLTELQKLAIYEYLIPFGKDGVYEIGGRKCYLHFFSRMIRIAVLFVQMITPDRRRKTLSPEAAVSKLLTDEMGCDLSLVKLFVAWVGIYPVGSIVRLRSGEIAQVCSLATDLAEVGRPKVNILKDAEGKLVDSAEKRDLSVINSKTGTYEAAIESSMDIEEAGLSTGEIEKLSSVISLSMS